MDKQTATKHAPATPLHGRRIVLQGGYVFDVEHQHAEHLDVLEHRAKAYPQLVEVLKRASFPGDPQWPEIRALLRSLGESA